MRAWRSSTSEASAVPRGAAGILLAASLLAATAIPANAKPPSIVLLKTASAKGSIGPYEEAAKGFKDALSPLPKPKSAMERLSSELAQLKEKLELTGRK